MSQSLSPRRPTSNLKRLPRGTAWSLGTTWGQYITYTCQDILVVNSLPNGIALQVAIDERLDRVEKVMTTGMDMIELETRSRSWKNNYSLHNPGFLVVTGTDKLYHHRWGLDTKEDHYNGENGQRVNAYPMVSFSWLLLLNSWSIVPLTWELVTAVRPRTNLRTMDGYPAMLSSGTLLRGLVVAGWLETQSLYRMPSR